MRALRARADVRALAHVTGGGIAGNLARVLPGGVGAVIDPSSWERPAVFGWLSEHGVAEDELRRVFNLGVGYCVVVPAGVAPGIVWSGGRGRSRGRPVERRMIGVLVSGEGTNLQALIDAGLPIVAVASNHAGVNALARAEAAGIATASFDAADYASREERDEALARWLLERGVDLLVLAGYMHLLRPRFFEVFGRRVVNTHSAPLPRVPGTRIRSRTSSPPASPRPRRPSTGWTRASTRGRSSVPSRFPSSRTTRATRSAPACRRSSTGSFPMSCGS